MSTSLSVNVDAPALRLLIFSFSSISSFSTRLRDGVFCVEITMNLVRCSTSIAVIGSPLTMTTTLLRDSRAGGRRNQEQSIANGEAAGETWNSGRPVIFIGLAWLIVSKSCVVVGARPCRRRSCYGSDRDGGGIPGGTDGGRGKTLSDRVPTDRAQAQLQHDRLVVGRIRVVGVFGDVIHGQDEAIVDIADADTGSRLI